MPPGAIIRARPRAASGRPEARLVLAGQLAERGSEAEAVQQIAAAAQYGFPEAQARLGLCYLRGLGVPPSLTEARRYYLWAAGEGVIEAMVAAGEMLLNGRGGRADPDLARALFEYAGKRNHTGANYALGVIAGNDGDRAMAHFRKAAALGHQKARLLTESGLAAA
jgi:TPR repeat protein